MNKKKLNSKRSSKTFIELAIAIYNNQWLARDQLVAKTVKNSVASTPGEFDLEQSERNVRLF